MIRFPLLRPVLYLTIEHESKRLSLINWWLPVLVSLAVVGLGVCFFPAINLFREGGLFALLLGFVQSLPGFYLAALAAVATFAKADLDQPMPGTPPRAEIIYNGQPLTVDLTRRRFLCMMFAYLTVLSIAITIGIIAVIAIGSPLRANLPAQVLPFVRISGAFVLGVLCTQMITITLWGLYYLGERMHTPDK